MFQAHLFAAVDNGRDEPLLVLTVVAGGCGGHNHVLGAILWVDQRHLEKSSIVIPARVVL